MKLLLAGVKRWYLRRFRGFVAAPERSGGTSWQQHTRGEKFFICGSRPKDFTFSCTQALEFTDADLKILSQDHAEDCDGMFQQGVSACSCPVTEARYVKICPTCHLGHWRVAKP